MDPTERKEQIIKAARKKFSEKGYYLTQISDIQKDAGVARGTIYLYFKNKDDIFATIMDEFQKEWSLVLNETPPDVKDYMDVFRFRIRGTLHFFAQNPDYCNLLLRIGLGLGANMDPLIDNFNRKMLSLIKKNLIEARDYGILKKDLDLDLTSSLLSGAFMRMAYHYTVMEEKNLEILDIDSLTKSYVDTIAYGIFNK